jgi:hypothetical protein
MKHTSFCRDLNLFVTSVIGVSNSASSHWLVKASIICILLCSTSVWATKRCRSDSYVSNRTRTLAEWIEASKWAVKVEVTEIKDNWVPYPNCYTRDRSKCNLTNRGTFKTKILEVLKGKIDTKNHALRKAYCSKENPKKPGIYIFYGNYPRVYNGHGRGHEKH